ncbi:caspase family protein [Streptomyces sp. B93]|uniref:effector-associated domain 2-containing protein n=1 Tax=Streptomyces sp. B93 TaxID=2824875 RepID=UPI001B358351|nr:caspase family protein [Streptomyces sp. B93]MBQ1090754.1 caspase family protein [Streptomyces sp. B93]
MLDISRSAHAVLVGVEQYAGGSDWRLDGPVRDAVGHARRLLAAGVPPERITLLLSPLPHNASKPRDLDPALDVRPATRDTVHEVLFRELPKSDGELFYLSWSGHGLLDAGGGRRLLYADAVPEDLRGLDLDAALAAWRSDLVPSFPRQLWLLDACQVFGDLRAERGTLVPDPVPTGQLRERPGQYAFFAAAPGQSARGTGTGEHGVFTSWVLRLLDERGDRGHAWLTDPDGFAAALRDGVGRPTPDGDGQTPTYLWHTGPDGAHERRSGAAPLPRPRTNGANGLVRPTREQRRRLVRLLERIPAMTSPHDRSRLIRQLPPDLAVSVPQSDVTRFALLDLIDTCVDFPGGLDELHEALEMVDAGTTAFAEFGDAVRELGGGR